MNADVYAGYNKSIDGNFFAAVKRTKDGSTTWESALPFWNRNLAMITAAQKIVSTYYMSELDHFRKKTREKAVNQQVK